MNRITRKISLVWLILVWIIKTPLFAEFININQKETASLQKKIKELEENNPQIQALKANIISLEKERHTIIEEAHKKYKIPTLNTQLSNLQQKLQEKSASISAQLAELNQKKELSSQDKRMQKKLIVQLKNLYKQVKTDDGSSLTTLENQKEAAEKHVIDELGKSKKMATINKKLKALHLQLQDLKKKNSALANVQKKIREEYEKPLQALKSEKN